MKHCERIEHARDMAQGHSLGCFKQTDPRTADQLERIVPLRGSSHFDDRQVPPVREEADVQFQPRTAPATNISLRSSARRSTRPLLPRLEPRLPARRQRCRSRSPQESHRRAHHEA